jgi:hypothetical protein
VSKRPSGRAKTAAERMAELQDDPEYVAERGRRDEELERKAAEWRRAEAPLVEELRSAGFDVDSAWDLVNTSTPYPEALPILLDHLERPYPDRVREGIARALAVRDARFGWKRLVRLYRDQAAGTDAKDGLAVALAAAADDDVVDELIALARDGTHAQSRLLLLRGLSRSKSALARAALEDFAGDRMLGEEARALLRGRG